MSQNSCVTFPGVTRPASSSRRHGGDGDRRLGPGHELSFILGQICPEICGELCPVDKQEASPGRFDTPVAATDENEGSVLLIRHAYNGCDVVV
ncbi:hypothetical protein [Agrobacterium tumefaciens]|uniref:hypothetical protein n=1 Tax=Agrobacterium tumefaciens TaxID=358 RepID=UPI001647A596|nr:hypothetical protein [Agrobacterium tumefaciens]